MAIAAIVLNLFKQVFQFVASTPALSILLVLAAWNKEAALSLSLSWLEESPTSDCWEHCLPVSTLHPLRYPYWPSYWLPSFP